MKSLKMRNTLSSDFSLPLERFSHVERALGGRSHYLVFSVVLDQEEGDDREQGRGQQDRKNQRDEKG